MIFVTNDVETKIQKALSHVRENKTGAKCLILRSLEAGDKSISDIAQSITDAIDSVDGTIYACEDGDIFVLAQGINGRVLEKLEKRIQEKSQLVSRIALKDPLFHWHELMGFVEAKILNIQRQEHAKKEKAEQEEKNRIYNWVMNMTFEAEILRGMVEERETRKEMGIMVVEDDAFTRRLIQGVLRGVSDIKCAADGCAAITKYPSYAPDIIFLDIDLPDVNGLYVLQKILSIDPKAYVVILSGNSQRENIRKAMECGAKGFIGKPFTKDKLMNYIQKGTTKATLATEMGKI